MAVILFAFGVLFLAALALDALGRIVHVPRVTLLILLGVVFGPPGLGLLPDETHDARDVLTPTALTMVAFLMGGTLDRATLGAHGRRIIILSLGLVVVTALAVAGGLALIGAGAVTALLLAGIATATDPAATIDVLRQSGRGGPFERVLTGIVAIDDAWGLLAFSLALTLANLVAGSAGGAPVLEALREVGGAIVLGLAVGVPGAYLTGRLKPGEPSLIEALGLVFVTAGAALTLELSYLIAGMTAGVVIVNLARHHDRPFHEIERIEWPFLLLFFILAGAALDPDQLRAAGLVGAVYIGLRIAGRIAGGMLTGPPAGIGVRGGALTGLALMPQAGVAVGMALVAAERFPGAGDTVLAVTIAATIVFEVIGPPLTQWTLRRAPDTAP